MYLTDMVSLVWKFLFFLGNHKRIIIPYLFGKKLVEIRVGLDRLLIAPRTLDVATIYEIYEDKCYLPRHSIKDKPCFETVLDIGANIGVFSVWALRHLNAKRIIAVEPSKLNYKELLKNIEGRGGKVKAFNKALFSTNGVVGLKTSNEFPGPWSRISIQKQKDTIESITLSKLIEDEKIETIDLLKMDIEGAEQYILTSENKNIFRNKIKYIMMEAHTVDRYNPEKATEYLKNANYDVISEIQRYPKDYKINWLIYAKNKRD